MDSSVAVIGAGALGLAATKVFKEDGFRVTTYETRDYVGGLWKDSHDSTLSVHGTTIFNSSKFRCGYSDFAFANDDDVFPTAFQIHGYLERYTDHFGLRGNVRLGTKVLRIERAGQKWALSIEHRASGTRSTEYFDKVCIATGSFYKPRFPKIEGLDLFGGKVIHSIEYHGAEPFQDQNVLLVGLHATTQDVTNSLSAGAKKVYMSHRGGTNFLPRWGEDGVPFDTVTSVHVTLAMIWMMKRFSSFFYWAVDRMLDKTSRKAYPDMLDSWKLRPAPSFAVATPLMADNLWQFMKSGFAEPIAATRRITGSKEVELIDGRTLHDIDAIIYCTGFNFAMPDGLLPKSPGGEDLDPYPKGSEGQPPYLYRNIFPISRDQTICDSLAFLGQGAVPFPGFVQFELNSMAISQVWQGNEILPGRDAMLVWRRKHLEERKAQVAKYKPLDGSTFYPIFMPLSEHIKWLDEVAGTGIYQNFSLPLFNWKSWKLWWQDRKLYHLCTKGVFTPAIWRLFDNGKRKAMAWNECRDRIIEENEMLDRVKKERLASKKVQ